MIGSLISRFSLPMMAILRKNALRHILTNGLRIVYSKAKKIGLRREDTTNLIRQEHLIKSKKDRLVGQMTDDPLTWSL